MKGVDTITWRHRFDDKEELSFSLAFTTDELRNEYSKEIFMERMKYMWYMMKDASEKRNNYEISGQGTRQESATVHSGRDKLQP